jgi:hypothetical protein
MKEEPKSMLKSDFDRANIKRKGNIEEGSDVRELFVWWTIRRFCML